MIDKELSKRKPIPKKVREAVYKMYDGHCAYCGCELEMKDMQADHVESVYRNWFNQYNGTALSVNELNSLSNFMPACRACNFYKGTSSIDTFREHLTTMLYRNLADNFNYKLLKKYGMIKEDIKPVVFYFEKQEQKLEDAAQWADNQGLMSATE